MLRWLSRKRSSASGSGGMRRLSLELEPQQQQQHMLALAPTSSGGGTTTASTSRTSSLGGRGASGGNGSSTSTSPTAPPAAAAVVNTHIDKAAARANLRRRSLPAMHLQEPHSSSSSVNALFLNPPLHNNPLRRRGCCDHSFAGEMSQYRAEAIQREHQVRANSACIPLEV